MLQVPNMPMPEVPVGKDDSENVVVRTVGEIRGTRVRGPKPHWETGVDARHHRLRARRQGRRLAASTCSRGWARGCSGR